MRWYTVIQSNWNRSAPRSAFSIIVWKYCSDSSTVEITASGVPHLHPHSAAVVQDRSHDPTERSVGQTTCAVSTQLGQCSSWTPTSSAWLVRRAKLGLPSLQGRTSSTWTSTSSGTDSSRIQGFPSANSRAARDARSRRGTGTRTRFTVCGPDLQQFSPSRHEASSHPKRG